MISKIKHDLCVALQQRVVHPINKIKKCNFIIQLKEKFLNCFFFPKKITKKFQIEFINNQSLYKQNIIIWGRTINEIQLELKVFVTNTSFLEIDPDSDWKHSPCSFFYFEWKRVYRKNWWVVHWMKLKHNFFYYFI